MRKYGREEVKLHNEVERAWAQVCVSNMNKWVAKKHTQMGN
jgi:hypothetical protein